MPGRVLVTGASGFIGRYLVGDLQARGYQVRASARAPLEYMLPGVEYAVLPDLSKPFDARPVVARVDAVVHLAGLEHSTAVLPESQYQAVNTNAVRRFAEAARVAGVRRFVFVSSVRAQCGPSVEGAVDEDRVPGATDAYGRSKRAAEQALAEALSGSNVAWTIFRPVLVYGPGVKGNMRTLFRLARSHAPLPVKTFTGRHSVLSLGNLASAIYQALTSELTKGNTYLVADAAPLTVGEMIVALRSGLDRAPGLVPFPQTITSAALKALGRKALADRLFADLIVDTAKLRATGWSPAEDTRTALAAAIRDDANVQARR